MKFDFYLPFVFTALYFLNVLPFVHSNTPSVFVFGDSLVDAGNNNYINTTLKSNHKPFGISHYLIPTGRFCDGRLFPDFIVEYLGLPELRPYLEPGADLSHGANFASAGSTAIKSFDSNNFISLSKQLSYFKTFVNELPGLPRLNSDPIKEAIYIISLGGNDIYYYLSNQTLRQSLLLNEFSSILADAFASFIREIYSLGARKIVFVNIPVLDCSPIFRVLYGNGDLTKCSKSLEPILTQVQYSLEKMIINLRQSLKDADILLASWNFARQIFNRPTEYGFIENIKACCGGGILNAVHYCGTRNTTVCFLPSKFMFWDSVHPSEASNKEAAQRFWSGNTSDISPTNIRSLAMKS